MDRICLVTLIGLPAVGKTSFCKSFIDLPNLPFNILHICYDDYIKFNMETTQQYKEQRENLLRSLETIIQEFKTTRTLSSILPNLNSHYKNFDKKDLLIICDDNHYYNSMRYKLYQMSRQYTLGYGQIYYECTQELALQNNNLRTGTDKVPEDIFLQMSQRLEPPNKLQHTFEENTLVVNQTKVCDSNYLLETVSFVLRTLENPVKPLELYTEKSINLQSVVHDLDLLMRKRIKALMNSNTETNKKILAKELNEKRKQILKEFQMNYKQKLENSQENNDLDLNKYVEMLQ